MNGREIRSVRKNLNMSKQEFADELGVSRATVYNYESGTTHPSDEIVTKIEALAKTAEAQPSQEQAKRPGTLRTLIGRTIKVVKADEYLVGIDANAQEAIFLGEAD